MVDAYIFETGSECENGPANIVSQKLSRFLWMWLYLSESVHDVTTQTVILSVNVITSLTRVSRRPKIKVAFMCLRMHYMIFFKLPGGILSALLFFLYSISGTSLWPIRGWRWRQYVRWKVCTCKSTRHYSLEDQHVYILTILRVEFLTAARMFSLVSRVAALFDLAGSNHSFGETIVTT
jgi:hypothetical protein